MIRRVVAHKAVTTDMEMLQVVTVFEPGINKEQARKANEYCKKHDVLVDRDGNYEWM